MLNPFFERGNPVRRECFIDEPAQSSVVGRIAIEKRVDSCWRKLSKAREVEQLTNFCKAIGGKPGIAQPGRYAIITGNDPGADLGGAKHRVRGAQFTIDGIRIRKKVWLNQSGKHGESREKEGHALLLCYEHRHRWDLGSTNAGLRSTVLDYSSATAARSESLPDH